MDDATNDKKLRKRESHVVPKQHAHIRFQEYGINIFSSISTKSGLKKAIKKGLIKINGEPASTATYIIGGETVELFDISNPRKRPIDLQLNVCYEDDYLAIINKPSGIVVSGNKWKTIQNALPTNLKPSTQNDVLSLPLPIHRLDFPTSGLLIVGKTSQAVISLCRMFEEKEILKTYQAISVGVMKTSGIIKTPIKEKDSKTAYLVKDTKVSSKYGCLNLVELRPATGRTHQLRIHLASIGNPILGDTTYAGLYKDMFKKSLYLHASALEFQHPILKTKLYVETELPSKFKKIFSRF